MLTKIVYFGINLCNSFRYGFQHPVVNGKAWHLRQCADHFDHTGIPIDLAKESLSL